ncbi:MAG: hypothetical protein NUV57_06380 [archaeon]|nr:hypothetical protein [archaeon]
MIKKRVPATLKSFRKRLEYYYKNFPGKYKGMTNEAGVKMRIEVVHAVATPRPYIGRLLLEKDVSQEVNLNRAINRLQKKHKLTKKQALQILISDFNAVHDNIKKTKKRFDELYKQNPDL